MLKFTDEMEESDQSPKTPSSSFVVRFFQWLSQVYQHVLDLWTPYILPRWLATVVLLSLYLLRTFHLKGWYIITYALGIYHLNLFIAFLTPKIDPAKSDELDDCPELPTKFNEEFRPFIRRLPEFKFWYSATKAILIAMFCTFFEIFNIPVFWPVLLMYFLFLFCFTMKERIKHMIKYRYLPWTTGKTIYRGKEDTGKIINTGTIDPEASRKP